MTLTPLQVLSMARAAIPLLPPTTESSASSWETGDSLLAAGAPAVIATLSAETSMQIMLVVSDPVVEALEGIEDITLVQALVPALEAAAATLATGVLENISQANVVEQLVTGDWMSATLETESLVEGWLSVRETVAGVTGAAGVVGTPRKEGEPATMPPASQATATVEQRVESMKLLYDVEMTLTAGIGRTKLAVYDALDLSPGLVIEPDRFAGSVASAMVNGCLITYDEIVVVDEEYGTRITEIVSLAE